MTGAAFFGVIGAVFGGILGGGATYFMARRQSWSGARAAVLLEELVTLIEQGARAQVRLCLETYPEQRPPAEEVARLRGLAPQDGRAR